MKQILDQPSHFVTAKCKFCGRELQLEIADTYAAVYSERKLVTLAACNQCADLRVARRHLEESLERLKIFILRRCIAQAEAGLFTQKKLVHDFSNEELKEIRLNLRKVMTEYLAFIGMWKQEKAQPFSESIVDALLDRPGHWDRTIRRLWNMPP